MENSDETDIRIRALLLVCHPTMVDLLKYFLKCKSDDYMTNANLLLSRALREHFKLVGGCIEDFPYSEYEYSIEIDISSLEISEIGGLLLCEKLELMKSLCCCESCEHECLKCKSSTFSPNHLERVVCVKSDCSNCGSKSHECNYQRLLCAVTVMKNLYKVSKDSQSNVQLYENFRKKTATLPEFPQCSTWLSLWRKVQGSLSHCCKVLSMKGQMDDDVWKDRNMDSRIALKKTKEELLYLFGEKIKVGLPRLVAGMKIAHIIFVFVVSFISLGEFSFIIFFLCTAYLFIYILIAV